MGSLEIKEDEDVLGLNIFYSARKYTGKDWMWFKVQQYQLYLCHIAGIEFYPSVQKVNIAFYKTITSKNMLLLNNSFLHVNNKGIDITTLCS